MPKRNEKTAPSSASKNRNRAGSSASRPTIGFGVPASADCLLPHQFIVRIPRATRSDVMVLEDLGEAGGAMIERSLIARRHWTEISRTVRREFNERLRENRLASSTWKVGDNQVDRLLGRELCVLGWALEEAAPEEVGVALRNWLSLRPEERWWLFSMTAATAGGLEHRGIGWRRALRAALAETRAAATARISRDFLASEEAAAASQPQLFSSRDQ